MSSVQIIIIEMPPLSSDPDLPVGGFLTLERADGRPVWREQFEVEIVHRTQWQIEYVMRPVKR